MNIKNFEVENAKKREEKQKKLGKGVSTFIGFVSIMSIIFSICVIVYGFHHLQGKFDSAVDNIKLKDDSDEQDEDEKQYNQMYGFGDGKYYSEHLGNPLIYAKIGDLFPS